MSQQTLAELAVEALSAVSHMTDDVTNDHPERHHIRAMKRTAESILSAALTQAMNLAVYTKDLQKDMRAMHEKGPTQ